MVIILVAWQPSMRGMVRMLIHRTKDSAASSIMPNLSISCPVQCFQGRNHEHYKAESTHPKESPDHNDSGHVSGDIRNRSLLLGKVEVRYRQRPYAWWSWYLVVH